MIKQFFKEYGIWYIIIVMFTALLFLNFWLYRLPFVYFINALALNLALLLLASLWLFSRLRQKLLTIQHLANDHELNEFGLPSDLAYRQALQKVRKQAAEQVLAKSQQLDQLEQIVKLWSHQMKIPVAAISLMSQTDHLDKQDIDQQLLRLEHYIASLLNYIKFSQHQDDFRFEQLSVRELIVQVVKKYRTACLVKELSVIIDGDWQFKTDRKWLNFAISQVLDNAIKYSESGGQIAIRIEKDSIKIQDFGIGILDEDLPRLFEEGFTGYNGHEHQKATGLGLYMTKQILDSLSLNISVSSQVGQGTCVTISRMRGE